MDVGGFLGLGARRVATRSRRSSWVKAFDDNDRSPLETTKGSSLGGGQPEVKRGELGRARLLLLAGQRLQSN